MRWRRRYGAIIRLLVLTGQRREEVGGMRWSELDLDKRLWRIGAERTKNSLSHEVPLSDAALELLSKRARREGRDLVFGSREGSFQGWGNAKIALEGRIRAKLGEKAGLKPWRLHNLRRTVATRMADLGVLPHVVEAVINHISGYKRGVSGVYNRSLYSAEKRLALDIWAEHVIALTKGKVVNIVPLRRA
jgi:integrase